MEIGTYIDGVTDVSIESVYTEPPDPNLTPPQLRMIIIKVQRADRVAERITLAGSLAGGGIQIKVKHDLL